MKKKIIIEIATEFVADILLIWLSIDLLYLYFAGKWYEPFTVFEIAELILPVLIIAFAIWRVHRFIFRNPNSAFYENIGKYK